MKVLKSKRSALRCRWGHRLWPLDEADLDGILRLLAIMFTYRTYRRPVRAIFSLQCRLRAVLSTCNISVLIVHCSAAAPQVVGFAVLHADQML